MEEEETPTEDFNLIDKLLRANRESSSLNALRAQAQRKPDGAFQLEDGLLMYDERLVVPTDLKLQAMLIKEVHDQISSAHPGRDKTHRLMRTRYYWKGMLKTIAR